MTTQVETLSNPETQSTLIGKWKPWEVPFLNSPTEILRGISYARDPKDEWAHHLLSLWGQRLIHGIAWQNTTTEVRGNPYRHGVSAIVANGNLRVYALTDDVLLCATLTDDGTWQLTTEVRPTFPRVAQLSAVQDGNVTDLYVLEAGKGDIYTLRAGVDKYWRKQLSIGPDPNRVGAIGFASSAAGRREIAFAAGNTIRLFLSTGGGAFVEQEPLVELPFTPQHVLLSAPRPRGSGELYAAAVAGDGRVASSSFFHAEGEWGEVITGDGGGKDLGPQSTAAAFSIQVGQINIMVTDKDNKLYPREYL